jgi:hypothetical protein
VDTKHITAVHYVHPTDPIGRLMISAAGDTWVGADMPSWEDNEYLRGQVETLANCMRLLTDDEVYDPDEVKHRAAVLIGAAAGDSLDTALLALYSPHHDWCPVCEKVTEYDGEECLGCGRLWGHDS